METVEYGVMYSSEDSHWWYLGLQDLVLPALSEAVAGRTAGAVLDAGCGTGRTLQRLDHSGSVGLDLSPAALPFLRERGVFRVVQGSVRELPFPDATFNVVLSADVLCCLGHPGDAASVREFARVLRPGGRLLLHLPAYPWLRSRHDRAVHIRRRYTRRDVRELMDAAGFRVDQLTYRNTILFPVAAGVRLAQRLLPREADGEEPRSDLRESSPLVNGALASILSAENRWIRSGRSLPFGLSVYGRGTRL